MAREGWSLSAVEGRLVAGLAGQLPGGKAHLLMAPQPRIGWRPNWIPEGARDAAALALLFEAESGAELVLTRRAAHLPTHRGQISLPGGGVGTSEGVIEAALREAHEEVGLHPESVRVLGELTPLFIPVSNFTLHPVIAVADERPELAADESEVAEIVTTSLLALASHDAQRTENRRFRDTDYVVPAFDVQGHFVWGATAMVLSELLTLLGAPPAPKPLRSTP